MVQVTNINTQAALGILQQAHLIRYDDGFQNHS